ncbi:MAG: hypothetical protein CMM02_08430 [Rhodopirellula sp.]|nr:hypothetical protein [Rhodopirellula sp.]|tara:strand:- start:2355 stop:3185 length:831 start_codon:yes stop_codon:yes gene_type:complete
MALLSTSTSSVEVVIAQFDENTSWVQPFVRPGIKAIIYSKGAFQNGTHPLPNVGRESHTYLHHIVQNYDALADWTVFTQAREPSAGYDHGVGGHMPQGVSFEDYLRPRSKFFWINTAAVSFTGVWRLCQSYRKSYNAQGETDLTTATMVCPRPDEFKKPCDDMGGFTTSLRAKCTEGRPFEVFYREFFSHEITPGATVFFPQGARFAASARQIRTRPITFYRRLLQALSNDKDPCDGYYMEWSWPIILGASPCDALHELLKQRTYKKKRARMFRRE